MLKFLNVRGGDFSVVTGPDDLFYCLLASGGDGTISGNSNVIPECYAAVYSAFLRGDYIAAAKLQDRVIRLNAVLSGPNSLACYKAGLVRRGVIAHRTLRSPLTELAPRRGRSAAGEAGGNGLYKSLRLSTGYYKIRRNDI